MSTIRGWVAGATSPTGPPPPAAGYSSTALGLTGGGPSPPGGGGGGGRGSGVGLRRSGVWAEAHAIVAQLWGGEFDPMHADVGGRLVRLMAAQPAALFAILPQLAGFLIVHHASAAVDGTAHPHAASGMLGHSPRPAPLPPPPSSDGRAPPSR